MNQPVQQMFAFPGVTPPPAPAAAAAAPMGAGFPMFSAPTPPAVVNWEATACDLIRHKVVIDGKPATTGQMVAWAYAQLEQRMRAGGVTSGVAERMCKTLESLPNGSVILGGEPLEQVTPEQRQAAIMGLVPKKLTYQGTPCAGTAEQIGAVVNWLWNSLPAITAVPDQAQRLVVLHKWLEGIVGTYEVDDATRAAAPALQQAPPNAVSDQKTPQVAVMAQPIVAPVATPEGEAEAATGEPPVIDPVDGTVCKSLRGLKTRATKTHKTDWPAFCQQHGLDQATGRKAGAPVPVAPGIMAPPSPPPISQPLPALVGQGAPVTAPSNTLYGPDGKPTPAYAAAQAAAAQDMPSPPAQQPTAPVQFTPTFCPIPQAVPTPPAVLAPLETFLSKAGWYDPVFPTPPAYLPPADNTPSFAPPSTGHTSIQSMPVAGNMGIGQPAGIPAGLDRAGMAQALGGAVTLIVCRLLEAGSANLTGRVDANQLSLLAEKAAREEMRIVDLAQGSYGSGKQAAQRHFAELLTKYPHCYLLMNGYEPILPAGFLEILIARTVHVYQVTDQGRSGVEIKF